MILITIGLTCLLELRKEQLDKNRKNNSPEKFFLRRVLFCCVKRKNTIFKNPVL